MTTAKAWREWANWMLNQERCLSAASYMDDFGKIDGTLEERALMAYFIAEYLETPPKCHACGQDLP